VDVALRPDAAVLESRAELERYLATVVLGAHLEQLAPAVRAPFVAGVAERLPERCVDYVRIEIAARRAP